MGANPSGSRQEIPVPNDGEVSKWSRPPTENGDSWINQAPKLLGNALCQSAGRHRFLLAFLFLKGIDQRP